MEQWFHQLVTKVKMSLYKRSSASRCISLRFIRQLYTNNKLSFNQFTVVRKEVKWFVLKVGRAKVGIIPLYITLTMF